MNAKVDTNRNRLVLARRVAAFAGATALTGALLLVGTGCTPTAQGSVEPEPQMVTVSTQAPRSITVSGKNSLEVAPDLAKVSLGIMASSDDAASAQKQAFDTFDAVQKALVDMGVAAESITTSSVHMSPRYDYSSYPEKLVGYEMYIYVDVADLSIGTAGNVIATAAANGANIVNGVSYYCGSYDARYQEALAGAMSLAHDKAAALATASGDVLGDVLAVTEGYENQTYRAKNMAVEYAMDQAAPAMGVASGNGAAVDPGTITIEASVTVEYEVLGA